jgi:hypothetical protein
MIYKNSVRTSQETQYDSATKTKLLMLFWETMSVYCENDMKHTDALCVQNAEFLWVKAGGTYRNHWVLNNVKNVSPEGVNWI